jgi:hypothetical protein
MKLNWKREFVGGITSGLSLSTVKIISEDFRMKLSHIILTLQRERIFESNDSSW